MVFRRVRCTGWCEGGEEGPKVGEREGLETLGVDVVEIFYVDEVGRETVGEVE